MVFRAPLDMSGGGSVSANRAAAKTIQGGLQAGPKAASEASLGNTAKSVDQTRHRGARTTAFRLQRTAARLVPDERVGLCRWAVVSRAAGVDVHLTAYEGGATRASFAGLQTCGSVWLCPCCGRRISETRRIELNDLLAWAREQGLQPVMVTLTARHGIRDSLPRQVEAMKLAKRRLRQRREWRAIKERIAGTVTATEVTHGENGWHTHFHEIILIEAEGEVTALELLDPLARVWRTCLVGVGLSGGRAAWQAQGAASAGRYVAKWGAGEEMTMTGAKRARGKGRTPLQLLADADIGDEDAGDLWRTYARGFKGRRQLVWSPGLKARAGITETSDEDAAADEAQDDAEEVSPLLHVDHEDWSGRPGWRGARHRRGRLLDAAEAGGASAARRVVEDGGTDIDELCDGDELVEHIPAPAAMPLPPMAGLAAAALAAVRPPPGQGP
ncbi:MAG: protein rep [Cryomorphaceae bacterium]